MDSDSEIVSKKICEDSLNLYSVLQESEATELSQVHGYALAELVTHIKNAKDSNFEYLSRLRMTYLLSLYCDTKITYLLWQITLPLYHMQSRLLQLINKDEALKEKFGKGDDGDADAAEA